MKYKVEYTETAKKQFKKMDRKTAALIYGWIDRYLVGCSNPRQRGKGLTANRSGQWRYRVGDYRIIAKIEDDRVLILVLEVGHRSEVYSC